MIKVSVMYPNSPGARFDHEYYRDKHMPLLKARMGSSCKYYTVDKGSTLKVTLKNARGDVTARPGYLVGAPPSAVR